MGYYPIFLDLRGRRCVVVGGGKVAERKVRTLLRARASVRVISPELTPRLAQWAATKKISVARHGYRKGDLGQPLLVFAATNDPAVQQAVREDAEALGALVNVADDREHSTFLVPASFAQGGLQVAISTSGASPALARSLRQRLQAMLGREYKAHLSFLREVRQRVLKSVPVQKERARVFRKLVASLKEIKRQKAKNKNQKSKI
ncbi:MAG: bifunctional precorrin-2 dehydrogenase/sirohydrochlorin ferrochelatase [Terriglobia bacterium]